MARLSPENYKPILQYHFQVIFTKLNGDAPFITYARSTDLPSLTNNPILIDYGNTYMHVKGKTRWNQITMNFYGLSEPDTNTLMWDYLNIHQNILDGVDDFKDQYMGDIQIQLLNPTETVVGTWKLINAFISEQSYGGVDWAVEEVIQPNITFVYDYAEWVKSSQPIV